MSKPFVDIEDFQMVINRLVDSGEVCKFLVAPNFEERSKYLARYLCENDFVDKMNSTWSILTLQGKNPHEIMDIIKARNSNQVFQILASKYPHSTEKIRYAELGYPSLPEAVRRILSDLLGADLKDSILVVDISCIPRNLLWTLLQLLNGAGDFQTGFPRPKEIYLVYSWAHDYSSYVGSETIGDIVGNTAKEPVHKLVEDAESIDAVVCTSGNTQDAFRTIDLISNVFERREVNIELVHFIRPRGVKISMRHLQMHQDLLRRTKSEDRVTNNFIFGADHALKYFREKAAAGLDKLKNRRQHRLLFAPFGPKLLSVLAQFVSNEYINEIKSIPAVVNFLTETHTPPDNCVQVVNSSGTQYLSLYSLGVSGHFSCVRLL